MTLDDLKQYGCTYIATPYTRYPSGLHCAYARACEVSARLIEAGIHDIYCPISHSHGIAWHGKLDAVDSKLWESVDAGHLQRSGALLVVKLLNWQYSEGIKHEVSEAVRLNKPIFYLNPITMAIAEET